MTCFEMDLENHEWGLAEAEYYRQRYGTLTFEEKASIQNQLVTKYHQVADFPATLLEVLAWKQLKDCRILELGGYNGQQALQVLTFFPRYSWMNYDVSKAAKERTLPQLSKYRYLCRLLKKPFWKEKLGDYDIRNYDIFYTSKTLEHMSLKEVLKVLDAMAHIRVHVHIIDRFYGNDTHVLEADAEEAILNWYPAYGYGLTYMQCYKGGELVQYRIMAGKNR